MKKMSQQIIFILLFLTISMSNLNSQILLREASLEKQIKNSSLVIEGKVLSKKSFWDVENKKIYTSNVVEVYKVFKGQPIATIEVITEGGTVGLSAQIVTPSLTLYNGDIGVYMLYDNNVSLKDKSSNKKFKTYGSLQGYYKYNLDTDEAVNPFNKKKGITSTLYNEIINITKADFIEIKNASLTNKQNSSNKGLLVPGAITFASTPITAGTKSVLTINGTGFGTPGKVSFSSADDGGATFIDALGTQIISWNSNQIMVEVPSGAGTGIIKVTDNVNASATSAASLSVTYSELNVIYDADDTRDGLGGGSDGPLPPYAYRTQHVQTDKTRTFRFHTEFNANASANAAFVRALDTWRCETGINWIIGPTITTDVSAKDDDNVIRFDNGAELAADVLGRAISYYEGCIAGSTFNWWVKEIDIDFDDATDWNFGPAPTPAVIGKYDFESVTLHELGHGHQLAHVIDNNDVMHYALQTTIDRRILNGSNITAASTIQARSTSSIACAQPKMTNHPCSLGIEEEELKEAISIYPNPTKGSFNVKNESLINLEKITVYDMSGRLISEYDMRNSSRVKLINLYGASRGVYFVNIKSDRAIITKKIVLD